MRETHFSANRGSAGREAGSEYAMFEPLIDPRIPLSVGDRREVMRVAWGRCMERSVWFLCVMVAPFVLLPPVAVCVGVAVSMWGGPMRSAAGHASIATHVVGFVIALLFVRGRGFAPFVRAELCGRGFEVCLRCGYPMGSLPAQVKVCPECGKGRMVSATG